MGIDHIPSLSKDHWVVNVLKLGHLIMPSLMDLSNKGLQDWSLWSDAGLRSQLGG